MIRFMSDTRYAGLEKEMQHIPGFRPRRSGMVISHLSGCLENQRSPCERRVTDCVPFYELLEVLAEEVAVSTFVSRVCRLTGRRNPCFFQSGHRERFFMMLRRCIHKTEEPVLCAVIYLLSADRFLWGRALYAATCSAVYLLSADRFLCSRALAAIDQEGIHFSKIHIHGVDLDGYVLFHMARDLYQGSSHIRLSELTDPELVSDRVFEWIMTACVIRRHGSRVLREEERSIDRSKIGQHQ